MQNLYFTFASMSEHCTKFANVELDKGGSTPTGEGKGNWEEKGRD